VFAATAILHPDRAVESAVAALGAAAFLLVPGLVARGAVGMGDVKLALLLGAALGRGVVTALLLGCAAASIAGLVLLVRHGAGARRGGRAVAGAGGESPASWRAGTLALVADVVVSFALDRDWERAEVDSLVHDLAALLELAPETVLFELFFRAAGDPRFLEPP